MMFCCYVEEQVKKSKGFSFSHSMIGVEKLMHIVNYCLFKIMRITLWCERYQIEEQNEFWCGKEKVQIYVQNETIES